MPNSEETNFNLVDEELPEMPQVDITNDEEDNYIAACEDCGYPLKEEWRACPRCGKALSPFDVWEILQSIKDAPTKESVEKLKAEKGLDVRIAIADEDRVYLLTPILRQRWTQLNNMVKNMKDDSERQEKLMELVVNNCVLWPKPDSPLFGARAGTYSTLYEQILHISDFMPPQVAIQMVYKL